MTKPAAAPVRVGPINLSSAGIGLNSTAVKPYFNSKLQLPAIPGLEKVRMIFPVAIPAPITSLFGWRIHPITKAQRLHTGTDIGAPMGTPVMAALGGRVILADRMGGYGISVAIEHDNGIRQTLYAHMSEIFVRPGDAVQQGTVIGRVGSTGASTGPHLHFELRQMLPDGTWVAQDASPNLKSSMAQLVQSLQIAQQQQKSVAQGLGQTIQPIRPITPPTK
ncbi:M23 family metallopeptidase [filamentous cyanobacterium LEGE 11480]|uniref:M23 family metallopeptidase n=2 Tax=Romeriopsis TaxID=2992131 RepID=A0A928VIQ3_9CYAN|nr:M23 family metallopeptidase [Romeriopsis navalis LEGE 11480]